MEVIVQSLGELLSLHHLAYLLIGVGMGMVVGVLPGMGGVAGMALLLPFVYGMEQTSALALMIGMLATTATGDTFPSILMGIPGGSSSATVLDGFPLARQGHAARALSASFSASLIGGLFGAVVLTGCVFIAKPLILGVGMGEQLLLILLALSMVGSLTGASLFKGLAACSVGLLLGSIGSAPATGELRYTFSTVYLSDGIPLVVLALGIFAFPEIVDLMRQRSTIAKDARLGSGFMEGIFDTIRNWWLVLRVSVLGAIVGILPGVGASTADWLAYGHVVQSSRDRSKFGKGDIRGVIAPEAANNAVRGGDLVPTLFFGIPGSGSMALLLGAFILIGLEPGARMVGADLHLTFVIIWSLALGNVFAGILCVMLAGPIARLTVIRYALMAPLIVVVMVFTAYQATKSWGDIVTLLTLTVFGCYMKRFDWPRPALVVGFVLSRPLEANIYQTAQVYGLSFLERPQSIAIALMVLASLAVGIRIMMKSSPDDPADAEGDAVTSRVPQIAFSAALALVTLWALFAIRDKSYLTYLYPASVGVITIILTGMVIAHQAFAPLANPVLGDIDQTNRTVFSERPSKYVYFAWFALFAGLIYVLGFTLASAVFVFAFLYVECGRPLRRNAIITLCTILTLAVLAYVLYLDYPEGLIPLWLDFPDWLM
ncbi:TctA family transporter [Shinella sp. BE166]|uniref:Tripartite tricarboxylate transporter permease n=1 Tax=Shinella lacus TaxID=2654216 RepID=A0ABT1QZP6_9HYPH|nr:tripartite tricarboxylate transporter permease [Shinella lacus]MCQ4628399.1 tripartite tricarboxylate transporter permease [Shinella lacus]